MRRNEKLIYTFEMQRLLILHESSEIIQLSCFVLYPSSFVDPELQKPRGQLLISESEIHAGSKATKAWQLPLVAEHEGSFIGQKIP